MALAITDDHAAQDATFYESPKWQRSPEALRDHLTHEEIEAGRDALARFVGTEADEAAGGGMRRDLFSDGEQGIYLTDAALLDRLARDKLAGVADQVRAERWSWVDVVPRATHAELHVFQRARRTRREPTRPKPSASPNLRRSRANCRTGSRHRRRMVSNRMRPMWSKWRRRHGANCLLGVGLPCLGPARTTNSFDLV